MRYFATVLCIIFYASIADSAMHHSKKPVEVIHSGDTRDCFFFKLEGVTEADPVTPNTDWFSVPMSRASAANTFSIIITAKVSGLPVTVNTTGNQSCGFSEVENVLM